MSHEAFTITSISVSAAVIANWERGLMYLARGHAATVVFVFFPKILATLQKNFVIPPPLQAHETATISAIGREIQSLIVPMLEPVSFDGDSGKSEGVRETKGEARDGAFRSTRSRGDEECHGKRAECGQEQDCWKLPTRGLDDGSVPMLPEDEGNRQSQQDPCHKDTRNAGGRMRY